jgi:hypothetical protein
MKTPLALFSLLIASFFVSTVASGADSRTESSGQRELAIVVVDTLQQQQGAITDFDRIDMAFQDVAKRRKWPVKIKAERLTANMAAHDIELRIFNQPLREETSGDLTFRGWMTLMVNGTKHDFGIVMFQYYPRAGEQSEDVLEKVFRGVANNAAKKIEPILFPGSDASKR